MNKYHFENNKHHLSKQHGAASIFIVIFFALLISVVTLSFVRIVNQDQQQALNNDLSQSAYDAAKAGVVDANRAIAWCNGRSTATERVDCLAQFEDKCDDLSSFNGSLGLQKGSGTEVKVGQNTEDQKLNQSYTCAKIQYRTSSITLSLGSQKMRVIELKSDSPIGSINVEWFNNKDAGVNPGTPMKFPASGFPRLATSGSAWGGQTTPPLLRIQLVQSSSDGSFRLSELNNSAKAAFLYPHTSEGSKAVLSGDSRGSPKSSQPSAVSCDNNRFMNSQLACKIEGLVVPVSSSQKTYLVVEPIYNAATVQVSAQTAGGSIVQLQGYPTIDVTGKAGDLFRRIKVTLDANSSSTTSVGGDDAPGFDSTKTLCKNFSVGKEYHPSTDTRCNN